MTPLACLAWFIEGSRHVIRLSSYLHYGDNSIRELIDLIHRVRWDPIRVDAFSVDSCSIDRALDSVIGVI
jgi:hypothetical protein